MRSKKLASIVCSCCGRKKSKFLVCLSFITEHKFSFYLSAFYLSHGWEEVNRRIRLRWILPTPSLLMITHLFDVAVDLRNKMAHTRIFEPSSMKRMKKHAWSDVHVVVGDRIPVDVGIVLVMQMRRDQLDIIVFHWDECLHSKGSLWKAMGWVGGVLFDGLFSPVDGFFEEDERVRVRFKENDPKHIIRWSFWMELNPFVIRYV